MEHQTQREREEYLEKNVSEGPLGLVERARREGRSVIVSCRNDRKVIGEIVAFDYHFNLLMREVEEIGRQRGRKGKGRKRREEREVRRKMGLLFIRGDSVVVIATGPTKKTFCHQPSSSPPR